ncbi:hypothetical protein RhiirA5_500397 [Rhizophagus irregularis]|uniref:MULE transposase domain-containing protein n=1 Tax=Rhizophagus irregularis TaxID=588596 RepID=A0A2N0PLV5_9GLOM|nr:hypothetical protein RhiirA5_500397 [Rhizophagus irregularis]
MDYVAKHLNGKVIINNERFLLSNQDLINIRNSMTKEVWGLDKRKAEEINIDEFFGSNSKDNKLEQERGCEFVPKVAMTDCDHKERRALIEIWPNIHLILCLFHVLQSWENKLKSVLGHHGGHEIVAYRKEIYQFLKNFTEKLKTVTESTNINQAEYFLNYGRIIAANLLQVPLEKIPTTNNHLESFNSELKGNLKHELQIQLKERYKSYVPFLPEERIQLENHYRQLVYYTPDPNRDEAAKWICKEKKNNSKESLHNSEPTLTPPNDPEKTTLPINSSINHYAAIWKQEHITLATNLLANLNEIDFITKSINRLSDNIPDGIEENAKCLNIEMKSILEKNE